MKSFPRARWVALTSVVAISLSVRSGMIALRSSMPSYANRIAPAVNRLLPPLSAYGARSSMITRAPASCAAWAAQKAAFPAPTTITS